MADLQRVRELIEQQVDAAGLELVRVKLFGSGSEAGGERTLQVMAEDATGQLVIDQCMALSRAISDAIDAREEAGEELIEGTYRLEVSSPGIDRPLTRAKDFAAWVGHEAKLALSEAHGGRKTLIGELVGLEGGAVTIEDRKSGRVAVPLDAIHSAKLVLTDRLIAAAGPLDASGAEEHEFDDEQPDAVPATERED